MQETQGRIQAPTNGAQNPSSKARQQKSVGTADRQQLDVGTADPLAYMAGQVAREE